MLRKYLTKGLFLRTNVRLISKSSDFLDYAKSKIPAKPTLKDVQNKLPKRPSLDFNNLQLPFLPHLPPKPHQQDLKEARTKLPNFTNDLQQLPKGKINPETFHSALETWILYLVNQKHHSKSTTAAAAESVAATVNRNKKALFGHLNNHKEAATQTANKATMNAAATIYNQKEVVAKAVNKFTASATTSMKGNHKALFDHLNLQAEAATEAAGKISNKVTNQFQSGSAGSVADTLLKSTQNMRDIVHTNQQAAHTLANTHARVIGQILSDSLPTATKENFIIQATELLKERLRIDEAREFALEQKAIYEMLNFELNQLKETIQPTSSATTLSSFDPFQLAAVYDNHEMSKLERWKSWHDPSKIAEQEVGQKLNEYIIFCSAVYDENIDSMMTEINVKENDDEMHWSYLGGCSYSQPGRPAHALLIDKTKQRLVLAIRGTSTMADGLTDIIATSVPFPSLPSSNNNKDRKKVAHAGFVLGAKNIFSHLQPTLESALDNNDIEELVVVGHSLGAGTASVMTVLLGENYPNLLTDQKLSCFAYACPPSMSMSLSNSCSDYITSVIHSDDIVCSASIHSFVHLFNEVHKSDGVLYTIRVAEQLLSKFETGDEKSDWLLNQIKERLQADAENVNTLVNEETWKLPESPLLYPAGRTIHLIRDVDMINGNEEVSEYVAIDATRRKDRFQRLYLSPNMLSDHSLGMYKSSMNACFGKHTQVSVTRE
jgi:hypothetical protein